MTLTSRILQELQRQPATAREMSAALGHDHKKVSAALSTLAHNGCVATDRSGERFVYRFVRASKGRAA